MHCCRVLCCLLKQVAMTDFVLLYSPHQPLTMNLSFPLARLQNLHHCSGEEIQKTAAPQQQEPRPDQQQGQTSPTSSQTATTRVTSTSTSGNNKSRAQQTRQLQIVTSPCFCCWWEQRQCRRRRPRPNRVGAAGLPLEPEARPSYSRAYQPRQHLFLQLCAAERLQGQAPA